MKLILVNPASKDLADNIIDEASKLYEKREEELSPDVLRKLEKVVMLNVIDNRWREHLLEMDYLKEGIGLRAIGQRDPLVEYKHESYNLFKNLVDEIKLDDTKLLFNAKVVTKEEQEKEREKVYKNITTSGPPKGSSEVVKTRYVKDKKIGRNDPCPCGSGKKYKKCCGR